MLQPLTSAFNSLSLDELNERAALLSREENKYLLTSGQFSELIHDLQQHFDILQIDGQRVFSYQSTYFDSDNFIGYQYHHQGRTKRRFKIRTRHYVESGLCYFEIKLKSKRGGTIKKRIPYAIENFGRITPEAEKFLNKTYSDVYGESFTHDLGPQMEVYYNRITLVAKAGGERMTIDFNLSFKSPDASTPVRSLLIVETKSNTGKGIADSIFRSYGIKSRSCSKYCLGANLLEYKVKYNGFKPLLKHYNNLPLYIEA